MRNLMTCSAIFNTKFLLIFIILYFTFNLYNIKFRTIPLPNINDILF